MAISGIFASPPGLHRMEENQKLLMDVSNMSKDKKNWTSKEELS